VYSIIVENEIAYKNWMVHITQ